ncbi:MAG: PilN domain-containing protein [Tepidisphaerales bacterium]
MAHDNQLSFLPEDYLEKKSQRRASIICGLLFLCVMGGLGSAFWLSEQATHQLEKEDSLVQQQYVNEARQIQQVKEMQSKQRHMAHQAEITASLLERVPRSFLLAEFTNLLPAGVSLLDMTLDSKLTVKPAVEAPKTAFEQKKAAKAPPREPGTALPEPKKYDVTIKLVGIATNDGNVAEYLKKLSQSRLLKDVNLNFTEPALLDKQPVRKFEMEMSLNPAADAQQIAPPAGSRVADVSVEK